MLLLLTLNFIGHVDHVILPPTSVTARSLSGMDWIHRLRIIVLVEGTQICEEVDESVAESIKSGPFSTKLCIRNSNKCFGIFNFSYRPNIIRVVKHLNVIWGKKTGPKNDFSHSLFIKSQPEMLILRLNDTSDKHFT